MGGHAHRHGVEARPRQIADRVRLADGRDQGQGTRPELLGQSQRPLVEDGDPARRLDVGDMGDQRVEPWPALGLEDGGYGLGIRRVGGQAVDRFGRQDDEAALAKRLGGVACRAQRCSSK
jgi:hypothetical protein